MGIMPIVLIINAIVLLLLIYSTTQNEPNAKTQFKLIVSILLCTTIRFVISPAFLTGATVLILVVAIYNIRIGGK